MSTKENIFTFVDDIYLSFSSFSCHENVAILEPKLVLQNPLFANIIHFPRRNERITFYCIPQKRIDSVHFSIFIELIPFFVHSLHVTGFFFFIPDIRFYSRL